MSDVTAAAERLRIVIDLPEGWSHEVYKGFDRPAEQCLLDRVTTSDAYLAEHPADDAEPITPEWFSSVMESERQLEDGLRYWTPGKSICFYLDGAVYVQHQEFKPIKTRGDVRRRCSALGIELKEQS